MKAIETKYLPATNCKGSRIMAMAEGCRVVVPYDHEARNAHRVAALALCAKMGWAGDLIEGGKADGSGCVYVFAAGDVVRNPVGSTMAARLSAKLGKGGK